MYLRNYIENKILGIYNELIKFIHIKKIAYFETAWLEAVNK